MSGPTDEELIKLASDLEYVGFSTAEFRQSLVEAGWNIGDVKKALVTYIMMGNNASQTRRVERAANPEEAKKITSWLAGKDVKKSAKSGNPITLGRMAKAYAPAVIILRGMLKAKLRAQFPTSSPVEQCDIALLGYSGCRQCSNSRDYVEKFGIIISKVAFPALTESDLRLRNEGFSKIAEEGLSRDIVMKKILDSDAMGSLDAVLMLLHAAPATKAKTTTAAAKAPAPPAHPASSTIA